ncbi:hypothetical protein CP10881SC42_0205 [Chlamydia avium]|uniref:Uncharacterized protein n=1 Tax=Chlamydia avium TaxID=1457141 RepID=A0ABN0MSQ0_9CHLA|nr:hypothetical protein CP10881SC42_0205 [Chlamydia avium]
MTIHGLFLKQVENKREIFLSERIVFSVKPERTIHKEIWF